MAARDWFNDTLYPYRFDTSIVVVGDAMGPDTWAIGWAADWAIPWLMYCVDGNVIDSTGLPHARWIDTPAPDTGIHHEWAERCLLRDVCMATATALLDPNAEAHGFIDPDSRTHGTATTLKAAGAAGLRTHPYMWGSQPKAPPQGVLF